MAASLIRTCVLPRIAKTGFVLRPAIVGFQATNDSRRSYKNHVKGFLKEMFEKREEIGPDKPRRRSDWINWNYDSEIFSFGKRLGEDFDESLLRQAFVHSSYIEQERERMADLGLDFAGSNTLELEDNTELANEGEKLISSYVRAYLRNIYPYMFEECISVIHDHLVSEETLAEISFHLGCEDLVLCQEYPPVEKSTLCVTFKAIVGALEQSKGKEQAEAFVRDFVLPQLVGKDVNDMWHLHNPMGLLVALLKLTGRGEPEPRLLWSSGSKTMMSLYWVGIYSDKQLISKAPGESLAIAEEMAARDAIKKIMRTEDNATPMILGPRAKNLKLDYNRVNTSSEEIVLRHYSKVDKEVASS